MNPKVTIIIPNWNGAKFLEPCIRSLEKQLFTDFQVIIVDNNSTDDSAKVARSEKLSLKFIKLERNQGFSGAVNVGIKAAKSSYIALLNNDTEQDNSWLAELVKSLEDNPSVDFAASKMLEFDNRTTINAAGDRVSVYGVAFSIGYGKPDGSKFNQQTEVFGASAGAALYRKSLFDDIGLFDEYFFAYVEDVDLSFRAQLAGHRCLYVPTARVYHHGGGTSSKLSGFAHYYTIRNTLLMLVKDLPGPLWAKYFPRIFFILFGHLIWAKRTEENLIIPTLRGYLMFFVGLPHAVRARRRIQRQRRVSAEYIDSLLLHDFPRKAKLIDFMKRWHLVKS